MNDMAEPKGVRRRRFLQAAGVVAGATLLVANGVTLAHAAPCEGADPLVRPDPTVHHEDERGRILLADSLTHFEATGGPRDVAVAASFAGIPTSAVPMARGVRGWIAHEAGPGLEEAGVAGLAFAEENGVPAAAIATTEAGLSDGPSLLTGTVAHANRPARAVGIAPGMTGEEAAMRMLDAPEGRPVDASDAFDGEVRRVAGNESAGIYTAWSIGLIENCRPNDVFAVASHAGAVMGDYAAPVGPKGIIANDAGVGANETGIAGLARLDELGIAAATVATGSARVGDPTSTYRDGTISHANETARAAGVRVGQSARDAARLMLEART